MLASIVIRTYNEAEYLGQLLEAIDSQITKSLTWEVIVVDSGSTDQTLSIASNYRARIVHIPKEEFSFGRSLNFGCRAALGEILVFISGHCVPVDRHWLQNLVQPIIEGSVALTYGKQEGGAKTKFSEQQLFKKFYPTESQVPQQGIFCNNANAALLKRVWADFNFDESLTGLEDMDLAKKIVKAGMSIGYIATASVYHYHDESWVKIGRRYEREAIALQQIMPEVHIHFVDFVRYFMSSLWLDFSTALYLGKLVSVAGEIILFRWMQFWWTYRGNHDHRKLSQQQKELYFYPYPRKSAGQGSSLMNVRQETIL
jgi:rhamnosyltransferase